MGIWDCEIVKANGDLYAFVRVQNDFTGNISGAFRRIYKDKNGYYCKVDGSNRYFNNQVEAFKKYDGSNRYFNNQVEAFKKYDADIKAAMEVILNEFVEFLIKETCQGCTMCTPGVDNKGVVCLHQGEAVWYRDEVKRFLSYKEETNEDN